MNSTYYREVEERLTGVSVPIVVSGEDFPLPPARTQQLHKSLAKLMGMPEFADFCEWMRQRATDVSATFKASSATADQLRVVQAFREFAQETARGVVNFVADLDAADAARKEWLENGKKESNSTESNV